MAKWRVYYTTGFNLSCSIVWSFLPSLVYRLSNMTEMQATVICNFFFKKNVHNLVTDFMVFLDLFTRKKIHWWMYKCKCEKNATNHCEILYQFLSLLPPPFFPFLCLCFLPFFFYFFLVFQYLITRYFYFAFIIQFNVNFSGLFLSFGREIFIKLMFNKPHGFLRHLCHFLKNSSQFITAIL